jgi:hypothetical protein
LITKQEEDLYYSILEKADAAATAPKSVSNSNKTIKRDDLVSWFEQQVDSAEEGKKLVAKPYVKITDKFFSVFHSENCVSSPNQSCIGLDVQYEMQVWRSEQLVSYILRYLPEVALTARELAFSDYLTFGEKLRDCVGKLTKIGKLTASELLPELMLHAAVRETTPSEPIGCKILYPNQSASSCMRTAYVVHAAKSELWLGTALLAPSSANDIMKESLQEISDSLSATILKEQRQLIIRLHEPDHLRPHSLGQALLSNSPIDHFVSVLRLPIMVAYDSKILCSGFCKDYRDKLMEEVELQFNEMLKSSPSSIEIVKIHIIFVPIDSISSLIVKFLEKLDAI